MDYPIGLVSDAKFPIETININTKTSRRMRSSDGELVRYVDDKHKHWLDYHSESRKRLYDALEAFMDINGGMWPKKEREEMKNADRHLTSINIAKQKMETLSGSLMSEEFDFDFKPLDIEENTLIDSIKYWYFADKEQYNYSEADTQTNMSGLLHDGVQSIDINYDIRRTGAISFNHRIDGTVLADPYWQTNRNKDWREAMVDGYLTPEQMIEKFDTNDEGVRKLAEFDFYSGETYENQEDVRAWENLPSRDGSRYLVTEYRWLEKLRTTRLHAQLQDGEWFAFPLNVKEDQVRDFIRKMEISWMDVKEFPYEDNILYYCIISPDLMGLSPDLIFVRGKHPIQCGGIGLFKFSSNRIFGIDKGVFEYILDLNRSLNFRQSKVEDIIASTASGMSFVNKDKIGGNAGLRQLEQNKTRPDYIHPVSGSPEGIVSLFPINQVPNHLFTEINNIVEFFDRVSPVTPALEGAATKDETGVLLELRHEITKLGTLRLYHNWMQFLMDKAEAWYNQAQITYKNLYRKVPAANGTGSVEFNAPAFRTMANGQREKVYINSISDLPRAKVIVTLSKASPTERMKRRLELFDTTKMLSAHPELFKNEIRILTNGLLATIEREPEEQVKLERMQTLQEMRDILEVFAQIEQLKAQGMEAQVMQGRLQGMLQNLQGSMQQPEQGQAPEQFERANRRLPAPQQPTPLPQPGGMI